MSRSKKMLAAVLGGTLLAGIAIVPAVSVHAQQQDQQGGRRGGRGGNFDPGQSRQMMMERMKEQLGASDDEWKVLQPKVEKVMDSRRDAQTGGGGFGFLGGGGGGGRGGAGGPGGAGGGNGPGGNGGPGGGGGRGRGGADPNSPVGQAMAALQAAVQNKDTPAEDLNRKLTALRNARQQAKDSLTRSQAELKELLTQRQEATMVMMGYLE
jgi:hypothetical protein